MSPENVYSICELAGKDLVTLNTLIRLKYFFRTSSEENIASYLKGSNIKGGRPRILNSDEDSVVEALHAENESQTFQDLRIEYAKVSGKRGDLLPSISTLSRAFIRLDYTTKMVIVVSSRIDIQKQLDHLKILEPFHWRDLINCDETHNSGHAKHQYRRARTKRGKRAFRKDFFINDTRFSVIAVYKCSLLPVNWSLPDNR
jgi:hypothetical protein